MNAFSASTRLSKDAQLLNHVEEHGMEQMETDGAQDGLPDIFPDNNPL